MAPPKHLNNANTSNEDDKEDAVDKHCWDKADLEKVTDFHEDRDEMTELSKESLGNLHSHAENSEVKNIVIRKEDVEFVMDNLEVSRACAERYLFKYEGDVKAAVRDIVGF